MQPGESAPETGDEETEDGTGEGTGGGPGDGTSTTDGGSGSGGGGEGEGDSGDGKGGPGGRRSKPSIPIRYRTFSTNLDAGVYTLAVTPDKECSADAHLIVSTVGDDQKAPAEIKRARFASGEEIPVCEPGIIGPIKLNKDKLIRIDVVLEEPIRVAMEVAAHEA